MDRGNPPSQRTVRYAFGNFRPGVSLCSLLSTIFSAVYTTYESYFLGKWNGVPRFMEQVLGPSPRLKGIFDPSFEE